MVEMSVGHQVVCCKGKMFHIRVALYAEHDNYRLFVDMKKGELWIMLDSRTSLWIIMGKATTNLVGVCYVLVGCGCVHSDIIYSMWDDVGYLKYSSEKQ